jgi:hypothetical protein
MHRQVANEASREESRTDCPRKDMMSEAADAGPTSVRRVGPSWYGPLLRIDRGLHVYDRKAREKETFRTHGPQLAQNPG